MERAVREMEPLLARKAAEGASLAAKLRDEQRAADQVREALLADEADAKVAYCCILLSFTIIMNKTPELLSF